MMHHPPFMIEKEPWQPGKWCFIGDVKFGSRHSIVQQIKELISGDDQNFGPGLFYLQGGWGVGKTSTIMRSLVQYMHKFDYILFVSDGSVKKTECISSLEYGHENNKSYLKLGSPSEFETMRDVIRFLNSVRMDDLLIFYQIGELRYYGMSSDDFIIELMANVKESEIPLSWYVFVEYECLDDCRRKAITQAICGRDRRVDPVPIAGLKVSDSANGNEVENLIRGLKIKQCSQCCCHPPNRFREPTYSQSGCIDDNLVQEIQRWGGRHPYALQVLCYVVDQYCRDDNSWLNAAPEDLIEEAIKKYKALTQADHIEKLEQALETAWGEDLLKYCNPTDQGYVESMDILKENGLIWEDEYKNLHLIRLLRKLEEQEVEIYADFELHVSPEGNEVAKSEEGEAQAKIEPRVPAELLSERDLKKKGVLLYKWLFPRDIHTLLGKTETAARQNEKKLRIRLRIDAESIAKLSLECLYREEGHYYFAINPDTVLSRYLAVGQPPGNVEIDGPLDLLTIIANPSDQQPLDFDQWCTIMHACLSNYIRDGKIKLRTIRASRRAIRDALWESKPHIVQFVGHGVYQDQKGYLALVGDTDETWQVDDELFANLFLGAQDNLRLVSLMACESAKSSNPQAYFGIAPRLVERGVPAVVGMYYPVLIETAKIFLEEFYIAIADRRPIDWAAQAARNGVALAMGLDSREFTAPVLYMRAEDGDIWKL